MHGRDHRCHPPPRPKILNFIKLYINFTKKSKTYHFFTLKIKNFTYPSKISAPPGKIVKHPRPPRKNPPNPYVSLIIIHRMQHTCIMYIFYFYRYRFRHLLLTLNCLFPFYILLFLIAYDLLTGMLHNFLKVICV